MVTTPQPGVSITPGQHQVHVGVSAESGGQEFPRIRELATDQESAPANLLAGPFAANADRARDAIRRVTVKQKG